MIKNLLAENISLKEILNNLNSGLYQINNYENIRITSKLKPDYVILYIEADVSLDIMQFFESSNIDKSKIICERTYNDFVVVSIDNESNFVKSSTISLFELIISSEFLQIEEKNKWDLNSTEFECYEINYVEKTEEELKTDMKLFG